MPIIPGAPWSKTDACSSDSVLKRIRARPGGWRWTPPRARRSGTAGYGHHSRADIIGISVHTVFGRGTINYFYARDADLVWLAVPPPIARAALAEVLGIEVDQIPTLSGARPDA